jgi:aspartate-semialdehyde dehydrogenase
VQTNKIKVGILGATGSVGQKFIELLSEHPEFEINELAASDRSAGKTFGEAVNWIINGHIPKGIEKLKIKSCSNRFESKLLFSALDATAAEEIEPELANRGHIIISNSKMESSRSPDNSGSELRSS